jgi:hypothetical protein
MTEQSFSEKGHFWPMSLVTFFIKFFNKRDIRDIEGHFSDLSLCG